MTYLKKGALGGYKAVNPDEAEYVAVGVSYYESLEKKVNNLEYLLDKEQAGREHDKQIYEKRVDRNRSEVEKEARESVKEYRERAEKAEAEAKRLRELNSTLLKMKREAANKDRDLRPKAEHPGYMLVGRVIQTSIVTGYEEKGKKKVPIHNDVWITTIETPYSCMLPINEISHEIVRELRAPHGVFDRMKVWSGHMSEDEGVLWKGDYNETFKPENNPMKESCVFDYHFQANLIVGLWEIQITTTGPVQIAEDMLYDRAKNAKDKGKSEKGKKKTVKEQNEVDAGAIRAEEEEDDIDKYQMYLDFARGGSLENMMVCKADLEREQSHGQR